MGTDDTTLGESEPEAEPKVDEKQPEISDKTVVKPLDEIVPVVAKTPEAPKAPRESTLSIIGGTAGGMAKDIFSDKNTYIGMAGSVLFEEGMKLLFLKASRKVLKEVVARVSYQIATAGLKTMAKALGKIGFSKGAQALAKLGFATGKKAAELVAQKLAREVAEEAAEKAAKEAAKQAGKQLTKIGIQ